MDDIILYSTGCPKCNVLKKKLSEKNIVFTENNNTDEMLDMGIMSVPVLKVNGVMMEFVEANKWVNTQEDN